MRGDEKSLAYWLAKMKRGSACILYMCLLGEFEGWRRTTGVY